MSDVMLLCRDAVLNVGRSFLDVAEQGAPNAGQCVQLFQACAHVKPPAPWCAAFVAFVGNAALGARWPAPKTASCLMLGEWGEGLKLIDDKPAAGDIVLYWHKDLNRFAHTGIVELVYPSGQITAIEGNTNTDGSRDGWKVCRKTRDLGPRDRVLHWIQALK